jgi:pimeloyl-ACP methyl ester carboxylesterase
VKRRASYASTAELEKHFVVVIWEQRGCGKSYPSINPKSDLTVDQYVADIIELTDMLRERFDEQKIYLVGHSWGTIIGVRAAQQHPELFHAYIGTAQMVDVLETDQMIYEIMMEHSRQTGDTAFVKTLETQGPPPYFGKSPIQPYATLFGREYQVFEAPNIKDPEYRRDGDILMLMLKQPEYGWLDRVYYLLGLMNTFNVVYPQLQEMDFRVDATRLDLPVYIVLGRHDMNNPSQIPEEYFHQLEAPKKELIFFEDSGHGMIWEEAGLFHSLMVETILPETYNRMSHPSCKTWKILASNGVRLTGSLSVILTPTTFGGLKAWQERTISFGELPGGLGERLLFVPHVTTYKGAVHATIPTLPAPDIATTGVISYLEVWPISLFAPKGGEQALVVHVAGHGLVLITGCGHPGLERLVERAESLYGEQVVGVVGGLHYTNAAADELQPQIQFLQSRHPELVALSPHDSGPEAWPLLRRFPRRISHPEGWRVHPVSLTECTE